MEYISRSPAETREFARGLLEGLSKGENATVLALEGDLGAGKTTFAQFVGEELGVHDPIQSPTFLIEKIYELKREQWSHLIHIDAYRLESPDELVNLGWRDIVSRPDNLILVEWASKVAPILPEDAIHIVFTHVDDTTRSIKIRQKDQGRE